jgi:hypothetical protein
MQNEDSSQSLQSSHSNYPSNMIALVEMDGARHLNNNHSASTHRSGGSGLTPRTPLKPVIDDQDNIKIIAKSNFNFQIDRDIEFSVPSSVPKGRQFYMDSPHGFIRDYVSGMGSGSKESLALL